MAKLISILLGIFILISATATLAMEDRSASAVVQSDKGGRQIFDESAAEPDRPVNSAQDHTLKIMWMIWSLKNHGNNTD